jgi:pimeloyl-ACP methyl ester carboxylesterase
VLAVMESLNIRKPVLVGESIGGEELSSVGSGHPDRISGLIYLEAAYQYAFDNGKGATIAEMLKTNLAQQIPVPVESDRANFKALQAWYRRALGVTVPEAELRQIFKHRSERIGRSAPHSAGLHRCASSRHAEIHRPPRASARNLRNTCRSGTLDESR